MSVVTVAGDGHVDVDWENAVPCPECGEDIYALDAKYTRMAQFYIEDGDGVYDSEDDFGCQGGTVYYCPHCGKELFDNHNDALKFLLSRSWVPDLLPMPLS